MEKKFKLFVGEYYYPRGGYEDFEGNFDSIENAKIYTEENHLNPMKWAHIVFEDEIICFGCIDWNPLIKDTWKWELPCLD